MPPDLSPEQLILFLSVVLISIFWGIKKAYQNDKLLYQNGNVGTLQFILVDLAVERRDTYFKQPRCFGFVAVGVVQDFLQMQLFGTCQ